jgi:Caspase domain
MDRNKNVFNFSKKSDAIIENGRISEEWDKHLEIVNDRSHIECWDTDRELGLNISCINRFYYNYLPQLASHFSGDWFLFKLQSSTAFIYDHRKLKIPKSMAYAVANPDELIETNEIAISYGFMSFGRFAYDMDLDVTLDLSDYKENIDIFCLYFALKASQINLVKINRFLEYQLKQTFNDNFSQFRNFLKALMRQYKTIDVKGVSKEVITQDLADTIQDWLDVFTPILPNPKVVRPESKNMESNKNNNMTNEGFPNGYALIIGVGGNLPDSINDANVLHSILIDTQKAGYPTAQVQLITQKSATKQGIITALEQLQSQVENNPNATVVIYFAGHGDVEHDKEGSSFYLLPNDCNDSDYKNSCIANDVFVQKVNAIKANKKLLLLDCCYAGNIGDTRAAGRMPPADYDLQYNRFADSLESGSGCLTIMACKSDEKSWIDKSANQGIFTQCLIEGLGGIRTPTNEVFVDFNDVYNYLMREVPLRVKQKFGASQTPILRGMVTKFPICRRSVVDVEPVVKAKPRVFVISDKRDNSHLDALRQSMQSLVKQDIIELKDISNVPPAEKEAEFCLQLVNNADIILCLLSDNYFDSKNDVCLSLQNLALSKKEKKVIPILLDDCLYSVYKEYAGLEVLPLEKDKDEPTPIKNWQNPKTAFRTINEKILKLTQTLNKD